MGQNLPGVKRVLELNPEHPILGKLQYLFARDATNPALREYAQLLYGQAVLAEGGELPDPAQFSKQVSNLLLKAL